MERVTCPFCGGGALHCACVRTKAEQVYKKRLSRHDLESENEALQTKLKMVQEALAEVLKSHEASNSMHYNMAVRDCMYVVREVIGKGQ